MNAVTIVIAAVLVIGLLFLFGSVASAFLGYSDEKAHSVRKAEANTVSLSAISSGSEVVHISRVKHYASPDLIYATRLDRHPFYLSTNIGLHMYGWGVMLAPTPNSNLSALSGNTQYALALSLLTGTSIMLAASLIGMRFGKFRFISSISDHAFAEILGDDVRVPYIMGASGLMSMLVSMVFYASTIVSGASSRLLGTLGGGLSISTAGACVVLGGMFLWRARSYNKARDSLYLEVARRSLGDQA